MKILIVDDSKAMRMIVKRTLKDAGFGDHTMVEAGNGSEGLEALRREPFDVVLCDWNMPEMSGLELLQVVMAEKLPVRFGFVTSESTPAMRQQATDAGAEFLIGKPFTKEVFQEVLQGVLAA
jgi:two-component system chemotaxis response regulator CheY